MDFLTQMFPYLAKLYLPVLLVIEFLKKRFKLNGWKVIAAAFVVSLLAVLSLGAPIYGTIIGGIWSAVILTVVVGGGVDLFKELLPLVGTLNPKVVRRRANPKPTSLK